MNGFYINLAHRTDRRSHFEKLKNDFPFFKNIKRMEAVYSKQYGVGCAASHINCLSECQKQSEPYYLIMEDDFFIFNKTHFNNFTKEFEKIKDDKDWDVITLTPRGKTQIKNFKPYFNKIIYNQAATAYIIKSDFIKKLLPIMQNGLKGLQNGYQGPGPNPYCTDQCWKPIQLESNWLYFHQIFGGQIPSYSDIEGRVVNYNKRFLEQYNY